MTRSVVLIVISLLILLSSTLIYALPYGSQLCKNPEYTCYKVKKGDSWKKLFRDETKRDLVMRINRMNTSLYRGLTIAIPVSEGDDALSFSPLPAHIDSPGRKLILVSIKDLAFGAYDADGTLEHWGPVSTARGYCPDIGRRCNTARGQFEIHDKKGEGCVSTRYPVGRGGAPMPYCMFFNGNFALHGSYEVPGYNASHGCIRLFVNDAQWLNEEFTEGERVKVVVR